MAGRRGEVPGALNEEYYQINLDILDSFNKYRPPLSLFVFREDVQRLTTYCRAGERLSNAQVEELPGLVEAGLVFVSRADHPVYVQHISYQLDLVLMDKNLHEGEIADIFTQALTRRLGEFFAQPVPPAFAKLSSDVMVLTEYLFGDIHRCRALMRRLHPEHTLEKHSFNCGVVGLAAYAKARTAQFEAGEIKRKAFDHLALGLFLHDLGMSKIPAFIREKDKPLTADERAKVQRHTQIGFEMLAKLDMRFPEVETCVSEHHERLDGTGYPQKPTTLSEPGRLCGLVDSFCAMTTKRPYAAAMEPLKAAAALAGSPAYDAEFGRSLQALLVTTASKK